MSSVARCLCEGSEQRRRVWECSDLAVAMLDSTRSLLSELWLDGQEGRKAFCSAKSQSKFYGCAAPHSRFGRNFSTSAVRGLRKWQQPEQVVRPPGKAGLTPPKKSQATQGPTLSLLLVQIFLTLSPCSPTLTIPRIPRTFLLTLSWVSTEHHLPPIGLS